MDGKNSIVGLANFRALWSKKMHNDNSSNGILKMLSSKIYQIRYNATSQDLKANQYAHALALLLDAAERDDVSAMQIREAYKEAITTDHAKVFKYSNQL